MFDVPDGVSDEDALAAGIAGLTAWLAVAWRAPVQADDTVLVLGASGALGAVAVQAAKLLGAARVIGAARRTDLVPDAADDVFDLSGDGTPPAATLIVDALWGEPIERALAAAAQGVRVVHLGQSAGPAATLESGWVRGKGATILGHSLVSHVPEDVAADGYRVLAGHMRDGEISGRHRDLSARRDRRRLGAPGVRKPGREDPRLLLGRERFGGCRPAERARAASA